MLLKWISPDAAADNPSRPSRSRASGEYSGNLGIRSVQDVDGTLPLIVRLDIHWPRAGYVPSSVSAGI